MNNKRKKIKSILTILALGVLLGFLIGFFLLGVIKAVKFSISSRYFSYETFRLAALTFKNPFIKWLQFTLIFPLFFLVMVGVINKLVIYYGQKNKKKLIIIFNIMITTFFFVVIGWFVNRYWLPQGKFHPVSLIVDLGIFIFSAITIRLLFQWGRRIRWRSLFDGISRYKSITFTALCIIAILFILNFTVILFQNPKVPKGPNIIFVMVDTLRRDHLGCYGYNRNTSPYLDELAKEGILFHDAYSNAPWTKPSVASFFTSLYPNKHTAINYNNNLPNSVLTLSEILRNQGWRSYSLNGGNDTIGRVSNFMQGFDHAFNKLIPANQLIDRFLYLLPQLKKERFMVYMHFMDVHLPYNRNHCNFEFTGEIEDSPFVLGKINHAEVKNLMLKNELTEEDKEYLQSLYDGQIRFVDENIKKLVENLKKEGLYQNTILVVTADHGEEFWEHDLYEHGHSVYNEILRIPMIIAGNGLTHKVVQQRMRAIDLMPTLLGMTGVSTPVLNVDGIDIFKQSKENETPPVFSMGTLRGDERYSLIQGNFKLIYNTGDSSGKGEALIDKKRPEFEFFNIASDPNEKENQFQLKSQMKNILKLKKLMERFISITPSFKGQKVVFDKELKDKLKTLGYF